MAVVATEELGRIVTLRAEQLRAEGKGCLETVRVVVDELYAVEMGVDSPIGRMAAKAGLALATELLLVPEQGLVLALFKWLGDRFRCAKEAERAERARIEEVVSPRT